MNKKKLDHENTDYENMYSELIDYQEKIHKDNLKRIKIGLRCVIIIPLFFLFLLFLTNSNKVIFLILWIVSLFAISAYLIIVEYGDYKLQHKMNELTNSDEEAVSILEKDLAMKEKKISALANSTGAETSTTEAAASKDNIEVSVIDAISQNIIDYLSTDFKEADAETASTAKQDTITVTSASNESAILLKPVLTDTTPALNNITANAPHEEKNDNNSSDISDTATISNSDFRTSEEVFMNAEQSNDNSSNENKEDSHKKDKGSVKDKKDKNSKKDKKKKKDKDSKKDKKKKKDKDSKKDKKKKKDKDSKKDKKAKESKKKK